MKINALYINYCISSNFGPMDPLSFPLGIIHKNKLCVVAGRAKHERYRGTEAQGPSIASGLPVSAFAVAYPVMSRLWPLK